MRISDWSSDVCSSELVVVALEPAALDAQELGHRVELVVALVAHEVRPPEASPRPHGRVDEDRHEMPAKFTVAQSWPLESRHAAMPTLLNAGLWMLARWPVQPIQKSIICWGVCQLAMFSPQARPRPGPPASVWYRAEERRVGKEGVRRCRYR